MTISGVGLKFAFFSLLYLIVALVVNYVWYPLFVIKNVPYLIFVAVGIVLLAVGMPIWVTAAKTIDRGFEEETLVTQGVYGVFRHPIYAQAILLTVPGILTFFRSWLLFTVPVFMYVVFKLLIGEEEDYLRQEFGPPYLEYEKKVNAVFPKLWKLAGSFFYPVPTGQIAENLYAVEIKDANLFIYTDGEHAVAIDAGYPRDGLEEELKQIPISPDSVTHLFLTHTDHDHTGGLGLFKNAQIHLAKDEEQMIDGTTSRLLWFYRNPRIHRKYSLLSDGDIIRVGNTEIKAIATPGHTPGSVSFLINSTILFTGDTLILQNGHVRNFYRPFNMDTATQKESIRKLAKMENIILLCTAHTGCTRDYAHAMNYWRESGKETVKP